MSFQLDIMPFLAIAGGVAGEEAWERIDEIYKKNRFIFYDLARRNKYYDTPLITGGDLLFVIYARRSLGILSYCAQRHDTDLLQDFFGALRKNKIFKTAMKYGESVDEIYVEDFIFHKLPEQLHVSVSSIDDDSINAVVAILLFLSKSMKKEIVQTDFIHNVERDLHNLTGFYTGGETSKFSTRHKHIKAQNKTLKEELFGNNVSKERDFVLWQKTKDRKVSLAMQLLFDKNELSAVSITRNLHFSDEDADTVMGIYEMVKGEPAEESDIDCLTLLFYIHALLKAYNLVKDEYFKNNKETMYVELEGLMNQVDDLRIERGKLNIENERLRNQIKTLENQTHTIQKLEKKINTLKEQLKNEQKKNTELNALREFVFSLKTERIEEKEEKVVPWRIKGVFVGGYDALFAKLKPYLPNFSFVSAEVNRFDEHLLDQARVLVIYPEVISHALYYFAVDEAKKRNIPLVFVSGTNIGYIIKKIGGER